MGTKNNPGQFDCYHKAEPDEPVFVLMARDPMAATLVKQWAHMRLRFADSGMMAEGGNDREKAMEALKCAEAMEDWRLNKTMKPNA